MKSYGQFCPLAQAAQLLCERWTLLIVRELIAGSTKFGELRQGVPRMSPTLLSTRLKQLVRAGIVERSESSGRCTYELTAAGRDLRPIVELLGVWGHRWAPTSLSAGDLDAGLLMWDMRRSIDPAAFPARRIVVHFHYPDAPREDRNWWLLAQHSDIDLCREDPGFDVDVLIESSLAAMTAVWTCQTPFDEAVESGAILAMGDRKLTRKLQEWLRASGLSRLGALGTVPELTWQPA